MAHDSRCENADTPPSDCDCDCGGSKHGNGFAEQQIHDLETDIDEINQLKQLTPDEYFDEDSNGIDLLEQAYRKLRDKRNESEDPEEVEQLREDQERLEDIAEAKGREFRNTFVKDELTTFLTQKTTEYDYDLTNVGSKQDFQRVLNDHGLTEYERVNTGTEEDPVYDYVWYTPNRDLAISTNNNPISGNYSRPDNRKNEPGYASYTAIEGTDQEKVNNLKEDFVDTADYVKDGGQDAGYTSVGGDSIKKLDLFTA